MWLSGFQLGTAKLRACGSGPASSPRHISCGPSGPHTVSHCLTLSHTVSHLCVCLCGSQASSWALLSSEPVAQGLPAHPSTSPVALQGHTLSLTVSHCLTLVCLLLWLSGFQLSTAEVRACGSGPASSPRHISCGPSGPHTVSHCLTLSHTCVSACVAVRLPARHC